MCGRQFNNVTEAMQHEADCYGLSQYEYAVWRNLVEAAAKLRANLYILGNAYTLSQYKASCDQLERFELIHHLAGMPRPSDWKV